MTGLVRLNPYVCPECDTALDGLAYEQLPLLRHGGYGAALRTVIRRCSGCGWALIAERGEVKP